MSEKEETTGIAEKNEKLLILYSQATSKEDKLQLENDLIELNNKFIYFKCQKFKTTKLLEDDKHALGMFGMMKAIRTFDSSKGIKFITYAARIIDNEILMELRRGKKHLAVASLEDTVFTSGDGSELRIEDALSDKNVNIETDYINQSEISEIKEMATSILNVTEQVIFNEMIVKDEPLTQLEVSKKLNFSQSYISRLKQTIKRKLIAKTKKNEEEEEMSKISKVAYKNWKKKGLKDKEIAEKMGVSIASLYSFKFENGLTKKHSKRRGNKVVQAKDEVVSSANKRPETENNRVAEGEVGINTSEESSEIKKMQLEQVVVTEKGEGIEKKENREEDEDMLKNEKQTEESEAKKEEGLVSNGETEMNDTVTEFELALLKIEQYEVNEYFMKKELESMKAKLELTEQINNLLMKQHLASIA